MRIISIIGAVLCWIGTKLPFVGVVSFPCYWDYMSQYTNGTTKIIFMVLAVFMVTGLVASILGNTTLINVSYTFAIILLLAIAGIVIANNDVTNISNFLKAGYYCMIGGSVIGIYGSTK